MFKDKASRMMRDFAPWSGDECRIRTELGRIRPAIVQGTENPIVKLQETMRQINARLAENPVTWIAE